MKTLDSSSVSYKDLNIDPHNLQPLIIYGFLYEKYFPVNQLGE